MNSTSVHQRKKKEILNFDRLNIPDFLSEIVLGG